MRDPIRSLSETAENYALYFENLSVETVGDVTPLISDNIHFVDPFNDVTGRDAYMKVIAKMFKDVEEPRFEILDLAWSGDLCLMRWDFFCRAPVIGTWSVRGVTEIAFDADGRICRHLDYWDASRHFYGRLPVIGPLIRMIAKKASI